MSDCKDNELRMLVVILAIITICAMWFGAYETNKLRDRLTVLEKQK